MSGVEANYIIKSPGLGWRDEMHIDTINPETAAVTGALDLTDLVVTAAFVYGSTPTVVNLAEGSGIVVLDAAGGDIALDLSAVQTAALTAGEQVRASVTVRDVGMRIVLAVALVYQVIWG